MIQITTAANSSATGKRDRLPSPFFDFDFEIFGWFLYVQNVMIVNVKKMSHLFLTTKCTLFTFERGLLLRIPCIYIAQGPETL